jgi:hypothetical protein
MTFRVVHSDERKIIGRLGSSLRSSRAKLLPVISDRRSSVITKSTVFARNNSIARKGVSLPE